MQKKKILYFVEAFVTYLCNLSNQLCNDFEIYIAYGIRTQTPKNFEKYFDKRIHLIRVNNYQREISFSKDLAALKEMKAIVNRVDPDLIHLNSSKAGILGRLLLKNSKIPVFYTPHGYSFLMTNASSKKRWFYKTLERLFAFKNVKTIACSKSEFNISKKITSNSTYVDNGINLQDFSSLVDIENKKMEEKSKKIKIATLGRVSFQKNPKLFNKIAHAFPELEFIWIGDGELRPELLAKNIKVTGWINKSKALNILNDADIFLLTSLWEGLPMALLEAMYLEKICLVSNVVGNKDVIKNGYNGYLCNNASDFIKIIKKIYMRDDDKRSNKIKENAKKDILCHYNSTTMVEGYKKIYLKALNN